MEIKCVKKDSSLEYPKLKDVSSNKLKVHIPNLWLKIGITTMLFQLITSTTNAQEEQVLAGDVMVLENFPEALSETHIFSYTELGLLSIFVISVLSFIIAKLKLRKNKENKKIKKIKNIFLIFSIISLLIFIVCKIMVL